MAFWLFKFDPARYRLADRLADPNPTTTWMVARYRDQIRAGDTAFLWQTGEDRGIRAVLRVDQDPVDMPELEQERRYWAEGDAGSDVRCRVVGTITHRQVDLPSAALRRVPGLENLSVFHGFQQGTNFPVDDAEGAILLELAEHGRLPDPGPDWGPGPHEPGVLGGMPRFELGRVYNRRRDIHDRYGGQRQGGISTPARTPCVFLFTGPSGEQHGYRDGWVEDGVFLYTGEGQVGDMTFVRGNQSIRDHITNGRDLHLFESVGKGEGYRYVGQFDCAGWEHRRAPDRTGADRRVIVFHLVRGDEPGVEGVSEVAEVRSEEHLPELRRRALEAAAGPDERTPRESRRLYYERSADVRDYVLARAKGVCEACRRPAPFNRPDGSPYLEPHHTRRVADGGPDDPHHVGGVCPNCHREVHHGEHGAEVNRRLEEYIRSVEADPGD